MNVVEMRLDKKQRQKPSQKPRAVSSSVPSERKPAESTPSSRQEFQSIPSPTALDDNYEYNCCTPEIHSQDQSHHEDWALFPDLNTRRLSISSLSYDSYPYIATYAGYAPHDFSFFEYQMTYPGVINSLVTKYTEMAELGIPYTCCCSTCMLLLSPLEEPHADHQIESSNLAPSEVFSIPGPAFPFA